MESPWFVSVIVAFTGAFIGPDLAAQQLHAEIPAEVSRQAPELFTEMIAPLLTSFEDAIKTVKETDGDGEEFGGIVVLAETVDHVTAEGGRLMVIHNIVKALSEGGAESLGDDTFGFRRNTQRIHLVKARTVRADGTSLDVRPNAAIIQTPQMDAGASLYSDETELQLVFPKLSVGDYMEVIVVIEEPETRMPGEHATFLSFGAGWPQVARRRIVELPADYDARLQVARLGASVPEDKRTELPDGRVRHEWRAGRTEGSPYEPDRPPSSQAGPGLWLSTLGDWDRFAGWYAGLVEGQGTLDADHAGKVDEWTKDLDSTDHDAILARLLKHAADDIRYTGLEFGIASLRPYDCNAVLASRYGDCKDKANLLKALLDRKGIRSHLTLVNTEHLGRIERRAPSPGHFNHALLAVELAPDRLVFCDPTIEGTAPGILAPSSADRDVLLIADGKARWERTPASSANEIDYALDLALAGNGEKSGWITLTARGYYAYSYAGSYAKKDRPSAEESLRNLVLSFFPNGSLIDFEVMPLKDGGTDKAEFSMKAYFLDEAAAGEEAGNDEVEAGTVALDFPNGGGLFPDFGDGSARESTAFLWRDVIRVRANVTASGGLHAAKLPRPLRFDSPAFRGTAEWKREAENGKLTGTLEVECVKAAVSPADFRLAYNALRSLQSWLERPLLLKATDAPTDDGDAEVVTLEDFPIMPTGQGQVSLAREKYPIEGSPKQREEAMRRVLQYFPDDAAARFAARAELAYLRWNEDSNEEAARQLEALLAAAGARVPETEKGWAEYILGLAYRDAGEAEKAATRLRAVFDNAAYDHFRRAWAALMLADLPRPEGAARDAEMLPFLKNAAALGDGPTVDLRARYFEYAAALNAEAEVAAELGAFFTDALPAVQEAVATELEARVQFLSGSGERALAAKVVAALDAMPDGALPATRDTIGAIISDFESQREEAEAFAAAREALAEFIEAHHKEAWTTLSLLPEDPTDRAEWEAVIATLNRVQTATEYTRHLAEFLVRFEPGDDFSQRYFNLLSGAGQIEKQLGTYFDDDFHAFVLRSCEDLPSSLDAATDARLIRGERHRMAGAFKAEEAILRALEKQGNLEDGFRVTVLDRLGFCLENQDRANEALACYRELDEDFGAFTSAHDSRLRGALIRLRAGRPGDAFLLLEKLRDLSEESLGKAAFEFSLRSAQLLAQDRPGAEAYWESTGTWYPAYLELRSKLGDYTPRPNGPLALVEEIESDFRSLGNLAKAGNKAGWLAKFDEVIECLRWNPRLIRIAASALTFQADSLFPEQLEGTQRLAVSLCESYVWNREKEPDYYLYIYQTVGLSNMGENTRVLEVLAEYRALRASRGESEMDVREATLRRIRSLCARAAGKEVEESLAPLEEVLADPARDMERLVTIGVLADHYRAMGKLAELEALYKRESENPLFAPNKQARDHLAQAHAALVRTGTGSANFSAAVAEWTVEFKPGWWDLALPLGLKDPRLKNLERAIAQENGFSPTELAKARLLAAQSDDLPLNVKQGAFFEALTSFFENTFSLAEARALSDSITGHERFSKTERLMGFVTVIPFALEHRSTPLLAHVEASGFADLADPANAYQMAWVATLRQFAKVDFQSPASLVAAAEALIASPDEIDAGHLAGIAAAMDALAALGALDEWDALHATAKDWNLSAGLKPRRAGMRLQLLNERKEMRRQQPYAEALRAALAGHVDLTSVAKPTFFDAALLPLREQQLPAADERAAALWLVAASARPNPDLIQWAEVNELLPEGPERRALGWEILGLALRPEADDSFAARFLSTAPAYVDTDQKEVRDRLREAFAAAREQWKGGRSESLEAMRGVEASIATRAGEAVDLTALHADLANPFLKVRAVATELEALLAKDDGVALRKFLEQADPDALLHPRVLTTALSAYRRAGLEAELELAVETARERFAEDLRESWFARDAHAAMGACELARFLGEGEALPDAWSRDLLASLRGERVADQLPLRIAQAKGDWEAAARHARKLTERFPTFYDEYFDLAEALFNSGRPAEARAPLEQFLKVIVGDSRVPEAKRMLVEIDGAGQP